MTWPTGSAWARSCAVFVLALLSSGCGNTVVIVENPNVYVALFPISAYQSVDSPAQPGDVLIPLPGETE